MQPTPRQRELSRAVRRRERAAEQEASQQLQRRAHTIREFCQLYAISRSQAYVEISKGRLKIRKVGSKTLIAAEDAEAWFAACAAGPRAA